MDKTVILNKIKSFLNIKTNKEFADILGIKPTTLSMWYKRNTFDIELIFTKFDFLNPEWLLTGEGSMLKSDKKDATGGCDEQEHEIKRLKEIVDLLRYSLEISKKHISYLEKEAGRQTVKKQASDKITNK